MTQYVFHYDLEDPDLCVRAAPVLADIHRRADVPCTFFVLGTTLEVAGAELRAAFGTDELFDLQSHTYSHAMLKTNAVEGPGVSFEQLDHEIRAGIDRVEQILDRECVGVRSGCGFYRGLQGEAERLRVIRDAGASYLSSDLRGPGDSIPGGLAQPYFYDHEGVPELLELPGHGWHDNVLKGYVQGLLLHWPPPQDWGIPPSVPTSPLEELEVQKEWVRRARDLRLDYISPVYHPHSVYRMSPDCEFVSLMIDWLDEQGVTCTTYTDLWRSYSEGSRTVSARAVA